MSHGVRTIVRTQTGPPGKDGEVTRAELDQSIDDLEASLPGIIDGRVPTAMSRGLLSGGTNLDDLNAAADVGHYQLSSSATYPGAPAGRSGAAVLEVLRPSSSMVLQRITQHVGLVVYTRTKPAGSVWSAWRSLTPTLA